MDLSIILPVYNVAPYLSECLDSILEKKLGQFEIIAVNDGSTDDSLKILEHYARGHDNLYILNKVHAGLSAARNAGMALAKGRFVFNMDSDDILSDGIYIFHHIKTIKNTDIFTFDAKDFREDIANGLLKTSTLDEMLITKEEAEELKSTSIAINQTKKIINFVEFNGLDYVDLARKKDHYIPVSWKRIYRRDFLNESKLYHLEVLTHAEDDMYFFASLFRNPKVLHYYETVIWHRIRPNSITTNINVEASLKSFDHILGLLPEWKKKYPGTRQEKNINWIFDVFVRRKHSFQPTFGEMTRLIKLARLNKIGLRPLTYVKMLVRSIKSSSK